MSFLDTMSAQQIFQRLGGRGHKYRGGYFTYCPCHGDTDPSLHIWEKNGRSYIHCHGGCPFEQLLDFIKKLIADNAPLPPLSPAAMQPRKQQRDKPPPELIYQPVPSSAPQPPSSFFIVEDKQHGKQQIQHRYTYRDSNGALLGYIARFPGFAKGKTFRPLVYVRWKNGQDSWTIQWGFPEPRPLYNLDKVAAHPQAPIIFCEGEKTANAAQELFPHWIATTTMNGASATGTADLSIAKGRTCIIWNDHDEPGVCYAAHLTMLLRRAGARVVHLMTWPIDAMPAGPDCFAIRRGEPKKGYDAADARAEGWTAAHVRLIKSRGHPFLAQVIYPDEDLPDLRSATNSTRVAA